MKWSKIIILCCVGFIISCTKMEIEPMPQPKPVVDIFSVSESSVKDGDEIMFKLDISEIYIIKLVDVQTNQVISKEKITGKIGENKIKVYTKSIQSRYLYLVLEDVYKKEIKKTKININ
jgi:AAA+ superfamily predicted ATPase